MRGIAALPLVLAVPVMAQSNPPLSLVVGFSPGGGVDTLARLIAQEIAGDLGRAVVVENRPGAGGTIAVDSVARAAPDGNTMLFTETSALIAPHVFPTVTYDPQDTFTPVGMVGRSALAVAVPASSEYTTLSELLDGARAKPGKLSYASVGVGSQHHLSGEWIKNLAGVEIEHVPYRGGSQAMQDLASAQIPMGVASLAAAQPHVEGGRVRVLAVLSAERFPGTPDVPTVGETLPGFDSTPSLYILAPAGTPQATVEQVTKALQKAVESPKIQEAFALQGSEAHYLPPAELAQWMRDEEARWVGVIDRAKLKFE
ncbi:MAG: tripartite tricarboxylate transporter substrate binding protein [Pigmentiphaga sp.]|nr:tripartite tricarboxylate transporter substrate binding protein [Pigmentiphaga sp.]